MVASGEQCRPRGRAERGGVEVRISKPRLRNPVERRRWDDTAEGARNAVALVVGHDQQDVWSPLGRHDAWRPIRLRLFGIEADLAAESRRRRRQVIAVDARGGVWRSRGTCGSRCGGQCPLPSSGLGSMFSARGGAEGRLARFEPPLATCEATVLEPASLGCDASACRSLGLRCRRPCVQRRGHPSSTEP